MKYLGVDIVDDLINENIKKYKNGNINFRAFDIVNFDTSEEFDLVLAEGFLYTYE